MLSAQIVDLVRLLLGSLTAPKNVISFDKPAALPPIAACKAINDPALKIPGIRTCCALSLQDGKLISQAPGGAPAIGSHVYTDVTSTADTTGYIYTKYGGIVDFGHLRDNADWTRYLTTQVVQHFKLGKTIDIPDDFANLKLPSLKSRGARRLTIHPQGTDPTPYKAALLGAYINFQLAVWHEISTFDDFSCFSAEDNYSNLLGTYVGYKACLDTAGTYEASVTKHILDVLATLESQETAISQAALRQARDSWFAGPSVTHISGELLKHHIEWQSSVSPWLVTQITKPLPIVLDPLTTPRTIYKTRVALPVDEDGSSLNRYFTLEIIDPDLDEPSLLAGALDATGRVLDSKNFPKVNDAIRKKYKAKLGSYGDRPDNPPP